MLDSYKRFWKNYANFKGRSTRADYWWVVLANFLIGFVLGFIAGLIPDLAGVTGIITTLYSLASIIPTLALIVRRMHDINRSGWAYLFCLIPLVGFIVVLVFLCTPSVDENNRYGERV